MSIVDEITRIKNNIKNAYTKAVEKGATLPDIQNSNNLPDTIDSIKADINLQDKTVEPTTTEQEVTADSEYDALSKVTVNAVDPSDYYKTEETRFITPSEVEQIVTASNGNVLSEVTVAAIPDEYVDTTEGTANESTLREGFIAFSKGKKLIGTYKVGGKTITQNGTYLPVSDNLDAYDSVTINVQSSILKDVIGNWTYTSTDGDMLLVLNEDYSGSLTINASDTSSTKTGTYTFDGAKVVFTYDSGSFTYDISVANDSRVLVQTLGNLQFTKTETSSGDTSGEIVTEDITITPTTDTQIKTRSTGKYINQVTVEGVTSSIDSNIKAENIKKDVTILGVTGTLEEGTKPGGIYTSNCINDSCTWTNFVGTWDMYFNDIDKYFVTVGETEGDVTFGYTQDGTSQNVTVQNVNINNGILSFEMLDDDGNTDNWSFGITNMNPNVMVSINIWNQGMLYPFVKN